MMKYFRPPDDIYAQLMQLSGLTRDNGRAQSPVQHRAVQSRSDSQDIKRPQSRTPSRAHTPARENHGSEPCTPSHWSPSVISGSPKSYHGSGDSSSEAEDEQTYDDDTIDQDISMVEASMELSRDSAKVTSISMDVDAPADMQRQFSPSTSSQMPPPAQPRPHILPSSIPTLPHASSSPRRPSPTAQDRPRAQTLDDDTLPPSSFPASTYQPPSPRSSPRRVPATPAYPIPVVRRVPPPQCHVLRPDPDASGEGRVLVENSDTASPGSHRFSQSQNRSQSQSQSQNQGGESQSQTESHGTTRSGEEPAQSQAVPPSQPLSQPYSQPQRPSQLRAELEPAVSSDEQLQHGRPTALAEGAESLEDANTASQLANEEPEQPKSQQSLSYKGDSQSQENIQPATGVEQPEQGVVPPEADGHVDDADPGVNGVKGKDQSLNEEPSARGSGQPVEPDPSPMAVDTPQKSAVAASPVGDAAPAWVAIGDAEDSDDSPTEVDELLSDPLLEPHTMGSVQTPRRNKALRSDPELARAREEPGQDQATPSRRVDLDSDDERTAAMVDQSEYLAKVTKIITARSRSAASERSAAERRNGPGMTEQSPRARGPAQPTHAKETGDARSPTKVKVNAKSRSSAHDPSIWYAPTFMRTTGVSKAASTRESTGASAGKAAKVPLPAAASRLAKRKASLPLPEPSPVKKRKTDAPPSSSAATVTSSTKGRPASTVSVDIVGRQSTTALGGHSCDFIQGSSTSDHGLSRKASAAMPAPHTIPPETEHKGSRSATEPARDVKYVDLRAASRSTSRASSRASSRHSGAGVLRNSSTTTIPRRDSLADTSAFQAASSRSPDSINSGPPPPASRTISSTSLADTAKPSRSNSGATSSSGRVQAALSTARHARVESSNPAGPSRVRPTGYGLSLDPTRTPGGPPLLSWEELLDILLKTGRARHQERQKEDGGGSA
ncbi:hypothetical protein FKP32DRAFT_283136 [Trametes sanguinea]|nr:hypothetical protein FKP32DRAFT_283136 [Trametes sanguinea]